MKTTNLFFTLVLLFSFGSFSQSDVKIFSQGLFSISDVEDVRSIESLLRTNPSIQVARLDHNTQRFFVLTNDSSPLTEDAVKSWFGTYASTVSCIQIGIHGQDEVKRYPFTECQ